MADEKIGKKDIWTKLQLFSTVLQILVTFILGFVGYLFTAVHQNIQEQNRKWQAATQILSTRELSEMEFRQRMFDTVLNKLLNPDLDIKERVTILRLFQHNFHDVFNGRAFFDVLEDEAKASGKSDLIKELYSIGKEIAAIQESIIEANFEEGNRVKYWIYKNHNQSPDSGIGFPEVTLSEGDSVEIDMATSEGGDSEDTHKVKGDTHKVKIELKSVTGENAAEVRLTLLPTHSHQSHELKPNADPIEFEVSHFDVPFTDNTILPDGHRISLMLKEAYYWEHEYKGSPHRATLKIIEFPAHYIISGYRPSLNHVQDMFGELENKHNKKNWLWLF